MSKKTKTTKTLSPIATLAAAATRAAAVAPRRAALPILTHARVTVAPRVSSTDVTVEATDCDLYTRETVTGLGYVAPQPGAPSQVCVDARALAQACKAAVKLNDGRITIERDDAHIVRLRVGPTLLPTLDAADYPPAPAVAEGGVYVGMAAWPMALAAVRPCVSTEETRYYLNGVAVISRSDGGVDVVATDGHRLAAYHAADATLSRGDTDGPTAVHAIIPNAALDALADASLLYITPRHVQARVGSRLVVSKLIEATYVDYGRVFPPMASTDKTPVYSTLCDVKSLSGAAMLAKQVGGKGAPVAWEDGTLRTKTGDAVTSSIPCSSAYSPLAAPIGFNSTYLAALAASFEAIGDTTPSVYMTDAVSPALWQGGSLRYVVLPMRV
jgi:DNA polymerase-3 subunit beta